MQTIKATEGREIAQPICLSILKIKLAQDHFTFLLKVPFPPVLKYVAIKFPELGRM